MPNDSTSKELYARIAELEDEMCANQEVYLSVNTMLTYECDQLRQQHTDSEGTFTLPFETYRQMQNDMFALRKHIAELEKQVAAMQDHPDADCTDAAHPAWWRGHDHTTIVLCQRINAILDGTETAAGVASEPWESTRKRLESLQGEIERLRKEVNEYSFTCEGLQHELDKVAAKPK